MLIVVVIVLAAAEKLQASSLLLPKNVENDLALEIHSFITKNSIVVQAIIMERQYSENIRSVVTSLFKDQQCMELYAIKTTFTTEHQRNTPEIYIRADALFRWLIVAVLEESDMLYQIVHRAQRDRHIGLIFLVEHNVLSESLIGNIIRNA